MDELRLLEEIRNDFVIKFDNDPQVKRICNIMINEFKARSKALTLTDVSQQRELLIAFDTMRQFDIKHDDIEESIDYFLKHKESYL